MRLYTALGLVSTKVQLVDGVETVTCNNFTLINLLLKFYGPTHEKVLVVRLLIIQLCYLPPGVVQHFCLFSSILHGKTFLQCCRMNIFKIVIFISSSSTTVTTLL
ncbi:UDP-N-acetylglucosamine--dolichyl-phosphate N-acetylglucosaminephosphotransferase [Trichinella spiralis]|uniref:UDP-N-acetylglucosamine--dolichyl-phosphate N-acetylglucosaminephosphotransferase n=1 Tax=Trichinella spiralis TaxID=6334 RepID=UPI0001EFE68E|nr:UDP-N-acetylglucosamine--dolichyl-phosphate N-acetylglucosaminephosphotransferase [Trichinella spiralis]